MYTSEVYSEGMACRERCGFFTTLNKNAYYCKDYFFVTVRTSEYLIMLHGQGYSFCLNLIVRNSVQDLCTQITGLL